MSMTSSQSPGLKVLQINLNHCWTAQQFLMQTAAELCIDVVVVSDCYCSMRRDDLQWV